MRKLLLILLCLPFIGFGQDNTSDSAQAIKYFSEGQINIQFYKEYEEGINLITKAINIARKPNTYSSVSRTNNNIAYFLKARANEYYKMEKYDLAIRDYTENIKLNKDINFKIEASTYFNRGLSFMLIKNYKKAITDLSIGLEKDFNSDMLLNRGLCYFEEEDYQNSLLDLNQVINEYGVNNVKVLEMRANCYFLTSRYHSSINEFKKLLKENKNSDFLFKIGCSYAMLNSKSLSCNFFKEACDLGNNLACNYANKKNGVCEEKKTPSNKPVSKPTPNFTQTKNDNKIRLPIIKEGNMKYIMITIGNKNYKYLIDTGASDMIINSSIERNLLNYGYLREYDYKESRVYEIANGQQIKLNIAELPNIKISGYEFNNIDIAIGDDRASLLLGMSFLNRFDWKITQNYLELGPKY